MAASEAAGSSLGMTPSAPLKVLRAVAKAVAAAAESVIVLLLAPVVPTDCIKALLRLHQGSSKAL